MKENTYKVVCTLLEGDDTITASERGVILEVCRNPCLPKGRSGDVQAEDWLTSRQAAERMSVSIRTIQREVSEGRLPSRMIRGCRRIPSAALSIGGKGLGASKNRTEAGNYCPEEAVPATTA